MRSRLRNLIETGVIESLGRGRGTRYHLSRSLHAALDKPGAYTRKRGLDHETNKALLERHLVDAGTVGSAMAELVQVFPALSRAHVKRLMDELRAEERACLVGEKRGARWYAPEGADMAQEADLKSSNEPKDSRELFTNL